MSTTNLPSNGWFKSTRSNGQGACVEVNLGAGAGMGVRDTKDNGCGPVLQFGEGNWASFVDALKAGRIG